MIEITEQPLAERLAEVAADMLELWTAELFAAASDSQEVN
jgi:hypothetical protein